MTLNDIFSDGRLFDGRYRLLRLLSTAGGSADVWLAADLYTVEDPADYERATPLVIKAYRPKSMIDIEGEYQFRNEFKKVFGCHHENIIQPANFSVCEGMPYLVLPYCPSGSSEQLTGRLTEPAALWEYIYEVASGLAYLHEHSPQIIHQDIKPANVLIDDNGRYAITDFGISAEMGGSDDGDDESGGTFAYMAPERFVEGTPPMTESDIWAFGATVYELITGDAPYGNDGGSAQRRGEPVPPIDADVPDDVKQLIYACLAFDAKSRPTARSIVDTVLKKRYSRNRRLVMAVAATIVAVAAALVTWLLLAAPADPTGRFDAIAAMGDSIFSSQVQLMTDPAYAPSARNIRELEKAKAIYTGLVNDAPAEYSAGRQIDRRTALIDSLSAKIALFEQAADLAAKARMAEMDDEYQQFSLVRENRRNEINQLIKDYK